MEKQPMRGSIPRRKVVWTREKQEEIKRARAAAREREREALRPRGFSEPIDVTATEVSEDADAIGS